LAHQLQAKLTANLPVQGEAIMDTYQQALKFMATTPAHVQTILTASPHELRDLRPAPDAWSMQEILAHLLHVETAVIPVRVQQMIAESNAPLPAAPSAAPPAAPEQMLAEWSQARTHNLAFLQGLTPEQLARTGQHPRYGTITVREHVVEWAYHDLDHLRQLLAVIQSQLYPDIGGFRALYPRPI
jgi:hypothetical protein